MTPVLCAAINEYKLKIVHASTGHVQMAHIYTNRITMKHVCQGVVQSISLNLPLVNLPAKVVARL